MYKRRCRIRPFKKTDVLYISYLHFLDKKYIIRIVSISILQLNINFTNFTNFSILSFECYKTELNRKLCALRRKLSQQSGCTLALGVGGLYGTYVYSAMAERLFTRVGMIIPPRPNNRCFRYCIITVQYRNVPTTILLQKKHHYDTYKVS